MNKISVLAKNQSTYFLQRLSEEVGEGRLVFIDPWVQEGGGEIQGPLLVRTSGVYGGNRDLDFIRSCRLLGPLINPLPALELFRRKSSQYLHFEAHGIPVLPWLELEKVGENELREFLELNTRGELLIKPDRGQGGRGIKVLLPKELLRWFRESEDLEYLIQPYQKVATELRIFFAPGLLICLERFPGSGSVAANFEASGLARVAPLPESLLGLIEKIVDRSGLLYGAIDLLLTLEGPVVLEVNAVPGIEQLEEVTGRNLMGEFLRALKIN